ncbi:ABC transporter ATP-binding protein [Microlunatus sp. Y2014]|uniref:ABC transporter ATP-binding protein n=1 Tax=Microlunatus sp. Y2014 TaxID=3418488 RepID=UPI003DA79561
MAIIELDDLRRTFVVRKKTGRLARRREVVSAVDGITAAIEPGEACGYIGANGAGKSTTIKMITGILVPTSGSVRTCGLQPVAQRKVLARRIGVVFGQRSQLWWDLPLAESFTILAAMHRLSGADAKVRIDDLVEQLHLGEFLQTPVRQLSLGQRMRGEVAAALVHRPELLILDEPTIGLDMISKERLRKFLQAERAMQGTTLLLTTHDMGDIERLCERVLVVDHGRLVHDGRLDALRREVALERTMVIDFAEPQAPLEIPGAELARSELDGLRQAFRFHPATVTAAQVVAAASAYAPINDLTLEEPAIEDIVRTLYERGSVRDADA